MSQTIKIIRWLPPSQLKARYLSSENVKEGRRWQLLWLVASGCTLTEAAKTVGYCYRQAHRLLTRYNEQGPTFLKAGRRDVRHLKSRALLNAAQQRQLKRLIQKGRSPDGGLWTGPKVAKWISEACGREVRPQRGWDYLQKLGFALRRPRPRHVEATLAQQEQFKKNSFVWQLSGKHNTQALQLKSGEKTNTVLG